VIDVMKCPLLVGCPKSRMTARLWFSTRFVSVRYERPEPHYKKISAKDRDEAREGRGEGFGRA